MSAAGGEFRKNSCRVLINSARVQSSLNRRSGPRRSPYSIKGKKKRGLKKEGQEKNEVMAQYRQSGADRFGVRIHADAADRIPHRPARIRRPGKAHRRLSFVALVVALTLVLLVALAAYSHLSSPRKGACCLSQSTLLSPL